MDTSTLSPKVAAMLTLTAAKAKKPNHNMPHVVSVADACENTGLLNRDNVI